MIKKCKATIKGLIISYYNIEDIERYIVLIDFVNTVNK